MTARLNLSPRARTEVVIIQIAYRVITTPMTINDEPHTSQAYGCPFFNIFVVKATMHWTTSLRGGSPEL